MRQCSIENCTNKHTAGGLCGKHYQRKKKYGDPLHERPLGDGWVDPRSGYRMICVNGKHIREHRHVMELKLGRKLNPGETVHHINHDRADNRPENLEVMTTGQHTTLHHTGKPLPKRTPTLRFHAGKCYTATCSIPDCGTAFYAKNLCRLHYEREKRNILRYATSSTQA